MVSEFRAFIDAHARCGPLTGDADLPTDHGYRVWIACPCGARFGRWVTPKAAASDLAFSPLLASRN